MNAQTSTIARAPIMDTVEMKAVENGRMSRGHAILLLGLGVLSLDISEDMAIAAPLRNHSCAARTCFTSSRRKSATAAPIVRFIAAVGWHQSKKIVLPIEPVLRVDPGEALYSQPLKPSKQCKLLVHLIGQQTVPSHPVTFQ